MAKYISRAAIAAAALALGIFAADATQYGIGTLNVSVNVQATCGISSVAPLVFNEVAAGAATTEDIKPSVITVNCNSGQWHLSVVADVDNDVRSMVNGSASLHYKLCNPIPGHTPAANRSIRITRFRAIPSPIPQPSTVSWKVGYSLPYQAITPTPFKFSSQTKVSRHAPRRIAVFAAILALPAMGQSQAQSLRVSPVTVERPASERSVVFNVGNAGSKPLQIQARVFRWSQRGGRDVLEKTADVR